MHVAITRALALYPIFAAVAAVLLSLALAPSDYSVMPPDCPPGC